MEVRTNTVDLVDRQMSGTRKKEGKTEEGVSGFKTMLKDKNQKKNSGRAESRETDKDTQVAAAETVVPYTGGNVPEVQNIEDKAMMTGQQLVKALANETSSNVTQMLDPQEAVSSEGINSMQFFNSLNIRNKIEKSGGIKLFGAELDNTLKSDVEKGPEIGLVTEIGSKAVGKQINSLTDGTEDKSQGINDNLIADKMEKADSTLSDTILNSMASETEPIVAIQSKKTQGKDVVGDEDKNDEKTLGSFQEKFFEPTHVIRTTQDKDAVINVTVNPDNLEDMEAKLSEQILSQIRAGKNNLELQLEPHNLGKITLKVSYEDNQVNVSIVCSESKTLKLISQSATELGTILESNLERPIQVIVDKQEADYLNDQQQGQQHGSGQGQHHQNQENGADESGEDFMHKLRLGFFGADSAINDEVSDR